MSKRFACCKRHTKIILYTTRWPTLKGLVIDLAPCKHIFNAITKYIYEDIKNQLDLLQLWQYCLVQLLLTWEWKTRGKQITSKEQATRIMEGPHLGLGLLILPIYNRRENESGKQPKFVFKTIGGNVCPKPPGFKLLPSFCSSLANQARTHLKDLSIFHYKTASNMLRSIIELSLSNNDKASYLHFHYNVSTWRKGMHLYLAAYQILTWRLCKFIMRPAASSCIHALEYWT